MESEVTSDWGCVLAAVTSTPCQGTRSSSSPCNLHGLFFWVSPAFTVLCAPSEDNLREAFGSMASSGGWQ